MYYNGQKGMHVSTFMNMVHNIMKAKYSQKKSIMSIKAQKLQTFFQTLKNISQNYSPDMIIENETYSLIIENLIPIMGQRGALFKNLFQARGGARFENELTDIIHSVWDSIGDKELGYEGFDSSQVNIGGLQGTTVDLTDELLSDSKIQKMLESIGSKSQKIITNTKGERLKAYYLPAVDGKIDVKGYQIQIRGDATAELLEIYNLLKDATFSAKNYDSMSWQDKMQVVNNRTSITLGKSNIYRSLMGSLQDLGYDYRVASSAFFAGLNRIKQGDGDVAAHFYHLRYLYELAGNGILYNGQSFGEVQYLIYNDPSGNIYVKDTASIISDIIDEILSNPGDSWDKEIHISKSIF